MRVPAQLLLTAASFAWFSPLFSASLVEKLRIDALRGSDVVEQSLEVVAHRAAGTACIVRLDRGQDDFVF